MSYGSVAFKDLDHIFEILEVFAILVKFGIHCFKINIEPGRQLWQTSLHHDVVLLQSFYELDEYFERQGWMF